jgi:hypothetical protein
MGFYFSGAARRIRFFGGSDKSEMNSHLKVRENSRKRGESERIQGESQKTNIRVVYFIRDLNPLSIKT